MFLRRKHTWKEETFVNIYNLSRAHFSHIWHDHYFHLVPLFTMKHTLGLRLTENSGSFAAEEENWTRFSVTINALTQECHTSLPLTIPQSYLED